MTRFILADQAYTLPIDVDRVKSPLLDFDLIHVDSQNIPNIGAKGDLKLKKEPTFKVITYGVSNYGKKPDPYPEFDGVTCDD